MNTLSIRQQWTLPFTTSLMLALALGMLGSTNAISAAPAEKKDAEPSPEWIVSTTQTRVGDSFDAWLVIPKGLLAGAEWTATLEAWPGLEVWWRSETETCGSSNRNNTSLDLAPPFGSVAVLAACAESSEPGPARLVALSTSRASAMSKSVDTQVDPRPTETLVAASEPVTFRPRFDPGPVSMAVLTALVGLIAGVSTQLILRNLESRARRAEAETSLQLLIGRHLFPDLHANWKRIDGFLKGGGKAPILLTKGLNFLKGNTGAWGYLGDEERRTYRQRLEVTLAAINAYNPAARRSNRKGATKKEEEETADRARAVYEQLAPYFKEEL